MSNYKDQLEKAAKFKCDNMSEWRLVMHMFAEINATCVELLNAGIDTMPLYGEEANVRDIRAFLAYAVAKRCCSFPREQRA